MSKDSAAMVLSLKAVRVTYGETVTFRGLPYRVTTKAVAGAKAGEQAVPRGVFGVFVADTSPRSYNFTPTDFAPTTNVPPPIEGEEITRNGLVNDPSFWPNCRTGRLAPWKCTVILLPVGRATASSTAR